MSCDVPGASRTIGSRGRDGLGGCAVVTRTLPQAALGPGNISGLACNFPNPELPQSQTRQGGRMGAIAVASGPSHGNSMEWKWGRLEWSQFLPFPCLVEAEQLPAEGLMALSLSVDFGGCAAALC